jgi:ABC-type multidrug transport system ATPase subunit
VDKGSVLQQVYQVAYKIHFYWYDLPACMIIYISQIIGEMLVGPAKALFMDEISTGLDSSTTFQIVNSLRQYVHILDGTAVISLLQPAPETYDLFDDIILLSDGYVIYQGPREHVLEVFETMGFKCPERKGVADFLQEVSVNLDFIGLTHTHTGHAKMF